MEILPLTTNTVNWTDYIQLTHKTLGISPTRGLDEAKIKIESPSAFLSTLDFDNQPLMNLRKGYYRNSTFDHVSFSFIVVSNFQILTEIINKLQLKILFKNKNHDYLSILTGSMADWHRAVLVGSSRHISKSCRILMNYCYIHFSRGGFKEIWSNYAKENLTDKTFILKG